MWLRNFLRRLQVVTRGFECKGLFDAIRAKGFDGYRIVIMEEFAFHGTVIGMKSKSWRHSCLKNLQFDKAMSCVDDLSAMRCALLRLSSQLVAYK